ncbi:hypothetical protein FGIG_03220 [Fasciola gigantica]|uniref:Uncharacterized protein n=1 Tax=Fasciola gigantica TaxID=46835 RepID=A0A504YN71_FASGI|nr:hypothetical protein FGIG_03220 [Fasciola gigantica]
MGRITWPSESTNISSNIVIDLYVVVQSSDKCHSQRTPCQGISVKPEPICVYVPQCSTDSDCRVVLPHIYSS